eukprot:256304_1
MSQIVSKVIEWYIDIIIISIALIICTILSVIALKTFPKPNSGKLSKSVYAVFISTLLYLSVNLLRVISLPLFSTTAQSQHLICGIETSMFLFFFGINNLSIDAFFIHRLDAIFQNTPVQLSKCVYYAYIITLTVYWTLWMSITAFAVSENNAAPYNIYTESFDIDGNGTTCMVQNDAEMFKLVLATAIIGLFIGNFTVWILFTRKFFHLLKLTQHTFTKYPQKNISCNSDGQQTDTVTKTTITITDANSETSVHDQSEINIQNEDSTEKQFQMEFINVMRDQTMLVSLMVFTSCFAFLITMFISVGQLLVTIAYIITLLTIFLSFKVTRYYFDLLGCKIFSKCCCYYFEKCLSKKIGLSNDEIQLTNISKIHLQSVKTKSNTNINTTRQSTTGGTVTTVKSSE